MLQQDFGVSERRACRLIGQPRGTQRYLPTQGIDEDALTQAIVALAAGYGSMTARASGCGPRIAIMSGHTILSIMPPMTGAVCG